MVGDYDDEDEVKKPKRKVRRKINTGRTRKTKTASKKSTIASSHVLEQQKKNKLKQRLNAETQKSNAKNDIRTNRNSKNRNLNIRNVAGATAATNTTATNLDDLINRIKSGELPENNELDNTNLNLNDKSNLVNSSDLKIGVSQKRNNLANGVNSQNVDMPSTKFDNINSLNGQTFDNESQQKVNSESVISEQYNDPDAKVRMNSEDKDGVLSGQLTNLNNGENANTNSGDIPKPPIIPDFTSLDLDDKNPENDRNVRAGFASTVDSTTQQNMSNTNMRETNFSASHSHSSNEDMDEELSEEAANVARANTAATAGMIGRGTRSAARGVRSAARGARSLFRVAGKKAGFIGKIGKLASLATIIILILMIIGAISFIINMPGMVLDRIELAVMDFWDNLTGFLTKTADMPKEKEVRELAAYLDSMGYDLEYLGFATKYEKDIKTGRLDKSSVKSKYLPAYMAAEQRNYMVENSTETMSLKSLFDGIIDVLATFSTQDVSFGTGLLHIEDNAKELLQIVKEASGNVGSTVKNKIKVIRREKELLISRNSIPDNTYKSGIEVYRFKLKYWLEKYTTPLDFYLALHVATRAPEFVLGLAVNPSQGDGLTSQNTGELLNTRVDINIANLKPDVDFRAEIVYIDIDPKTRKVRIDPDTNLPVTLSVDEIRNRLASGQEVVGFSGNTEEQNNDLLKRAAAFDSKSITAFTPYITKVVNHWYYKQVVYEGQVFDGDYAGKTVNVYQVENLKEPIVRYQMYESLQVPGYMSDGVSSNPSENNSNNNEGTTENENNNNGTTNNGGASGSTGGNNGGTATDTGTTSPSHEKPSGDDRKEMEELTQEMEDAGLTTGGFFSTILNLINSTYGFLGSINGITNVMLDLPSRVLNSTYSSLGNVINGMMPGNLLSNISNGWLSGLGYYANNMLLNTTNLGQYLDINRLSTSLGIGDLRNILYSDNIINNLGLGTANGMLANLSNIANINQLPSIAANALNMPELTGTFSGLTDMVRNGLTTDSLVNTMYAGLSSQMKDELSSQVLNYAKQAFDGISAGDAPTVAAGLIGGIATNLVDRTTNEFFNTMQNKLREQIGSQYTVQVEKLLQNENSKNLTGLTINELESMSKINGLDFKQVEEVNKDVTKIQESVNETVAASRELSNIVNEISEDYVGVDAVTFYQLAKLIREILASVEESEKQIEVFETVFNGQSLDQRTELQIRTNIERARTAMANIKSTIEKLEVETTRTNGTNLSTSGSEIARIIDTNKSKLPITSAAILIAQGNATSTILQATGDKVQTLDVNTITKIKKEHPKMTLEELLKTADELAEIDPSLNGLVNDISKMNGELKNINEQTSNANLDRINQYNKNIDRIDWLTANEIKQLKNQVNKVHDSANDINRNILAANLPLINLLADRVTGITTNKINNLANQILNIPNNTINSLFNAAREIPASLIREATDAFSKKLSEAIATETKEKLTEKVTEGLGRTLNGDGQLNAALQTRNSRNNNTNSDDVEIPLEGWKSEFLTGLYIKETRIRDLIQKSEPILVPYNYEHWENLFLKRKYLIAGNDIYVHLKEQYPDENLFENKAIIDKYGMTIWDATEGHIEESICAELESMDSVDSQYLIRYFKELFNNYGDALKATAKKLNKINTEDSRNVRYPIGWIFRTSIKEEIVNTTTGEKRQVEKAEYEPVTWTSGNSGTLYSVRNLPSYGFQKGIDIVSPANAKVINKTAAKVNELGEMVLPSITLQISSSEPKVNGSRVVLKGGDYSAVSVGTTLSKGQTIGKTTDDNIIILVLDKNSHAQVSDVTRFVFPPSVKYSDGSAQVGNNQAIDTDYDKGNPEKPEQPANPENSGTPTDNSNNG